MQFKGSYRRADRHKKVEVLHLESQEWKSSLQFMKDEIIFIGHLLNSYLFEPNTPNLFERLQNYRGHLFKVEDKRSRVIQLIIAHENDLGGMMECRDESCDLGYYKKHDCLKADVAGCLLDFQDLKLEIFNYAGGILKKRKPKDSIS